MIINKVIRAIRAINPTAEVTVGGDSVENIKWENGTTPISKEDINAKIIVVENNYNNLAYARARANAYPLLQEFAEAYCEKEIGGSNTKWDAYKTAYNKVRTDNPKS